MHCRLSRKWLQVARFQERSQRSSLSRTGSFHSANFSVQLIECEQRQRRKDFERAAGDGDSDAVPFPRPLLLLEDARTLLQKRKLCPNDLCHERGSPHAIESDCRTNWSLFSKKPH